MLIGIEWVILTLNIESKNNMIAGNNNKIDTL